MIFLLRVMVQQGNEPDRLRHVLGGALAAQDLALALARPAGDPAAVLARPAAGDGGVAALEVVGPAEANTDADGDHAAILARNPV